MLVRRPTLRRVLLFVAAYALAASGVWACSVPVFRYALEKWGADPYEVIIFHRGALTADQQALVAPFVDGAEVKPGLANLHAKTIDLDASPSEGDVALWTAQQTEELPHVLVKYPLRSGNELTVWSGPLDKQELDRVQQSPARQEIAKRLIAGETGVWVLLESGDKLADDAAERALVENLLRCEQTLELPEIEEQDVKDGLVSINPAELKLDFSFVRISRDDPAESRFVDMLLGSEEDLRAIDPQEPMAFPVFGRGRVLYALVGAGIQQETIVAACKTLIGACTCQVKEQNPGTDLVMAADWSVVVPTADPGRPTTIAGLGGFANAGETTEIASADSSPAENDPSPSATENDDEPSAVVKVSDSAPHAGSPPVTGKPMAAEAGSLLRNTLIVLGASALGVIVVGYLLVARKQKSDGPA